jgi:imidazolonepropionase-like amidohydrolase
VPQAPTATTRTVLTNARVFDGQRLGDPTTVSVDSGLLSFAPGGGTEIDCDGGTLLPGLIDAHVHLHDAANLEQFASFGVTTALDMASWPPSFVDSLRRRTGLTDIRSPGGSATAPGSTHSKIPDFPIEGILSGPDAAEAFVERRIAEGSDYIKVIADIPGPDQETLNALVLAAHDRAKMVIVHAASHATYVMGVNAGGDILTHVPLDRTLDPEVISRMAEHGQVSVPTLCMMEAIAHRLIAAGIASEPGAGPSTGPAFANCLDSVGALHAAGVPVLAGTDANSAPFAPAAIAHGASLHHELELLVDAGLTPLESLLGATALTAEHFGLDDRGRIRSGFRADLVLVAGDPLRDVRSTRNVQRVWCGGVEYPQNDRFTT